MALFPPDNQQQRLYTAEADVHPGRRFTNVGAAQAYVDRLLATPWWRASFPSVQRVIVEMRWRRRSAGAQKGRHGGHIFLPPWLGGRLTLLHELAHIAQPVTTAFHGAEFAGIYLGLARQYLGPHRTQCLASAFQRRGVPSKGCTRTPRHHIYTDPEFGAFWERLMELYEQEHGGETCPNR